MFAKVNVGTESTIAASLGIMSIPVIKFFCFGKEVGELIGYMPKESLKQKIDEMLQNHKQCLEQSSSLKH
jgi:thioredoxin 1